LIALDVAYSLKQKKLQTPKKHRGYLVRCHMNYVRLNVSIV